MENLLLRIFFLVTLSFNCILHAQVVPSIEWQKSLGGSDLDFAHSVQQTIDGGFIVAGYSQSNNGDVSGNHGGLNFGDYWIVKLDTNGNIEWQKCLGGLSDEYAYSIQQTTDGGFIVAGYSSGNGGDVSGNHGAYDYWIVKLDTSGNLTWEKSLGGSDYEDAFSVQQTADGGYIAVGRSFSLGDDVSGNHGLQDCWIVKLDTSGNLVWEKSLGGSSGDEAYYVRQTADGGYIVAGGSYSSDDDVSGNQGGLDSWIIRLDTVGSIVWKKSLGGSGDDAANSIQQTTDGGFIAAGSSVSDDGDVSDNHGAYDYWIVKLDTSGNLTWQKCLGGINNEMAYSVQQTTDGGFIIAGWSGSNDGDVSGNHLLSDYWIVKIDTAGNLVWQKSLGGSNNDLARDIQQTSDGGFVVAGYSKSTDGDLSINHGDYDYWIVKLSSDVPTGVSSFSTNFTSLYPNPVKTQLTLVLHSLREGGINLATPTTETTIRVYDLGGRMIMLPTTFTNTQAQLNTAALADGFYTLQIINNNSGKCVVEKFVKQ